MRRSLIVLSGIIVIASLFGCASVKTTAKEDEKAICPKCKKRLVYHKVPGRSMRRHRHVRYICPSCSKEWTGAPEKTGKEELVCPKCGCTLKECPACCKKHGK